MRQYSGRQGRGFAMVELVIMVVVIGVTLAILAIGSGDSRRRARLAGSIENLTQFSVGYMSYAKDYSDRVASFSWRSGVNYGFGGVAGSDLQAAANQAVDIIRRRGDRMELQPIAGWFPHVSYNHLVLVDYLDQSLPSKWAVSPGDTVRLTWQRDPRAFDSLTNRPAGASGNTGARWPYSTSYETPPAFYSPNQQDGLVQTVSQAQAHNQYNLPGGNYLGMRQMSEIAFPSQKAMTYETVQRFFGSRQAYFLYPEARVPVLTADGSVSVRSTASTNRGFNPAQPQSAQPSRFAYTPDTLWEPPTLNGASQEFVDGYMRWCRRGLAGRDFGGPEAP